MGWKYENNNKNLIKNRIRSESSFRIILSVILLVFSNSLVFAEYKNINAPDNKSNAISSTSKNTQTNNSSQSDTASSIASSVGKDSVGGNPAFTSFDPGTGALGRFLQIPDDWGVRLGGVSLADTNKLFTGGNKPGSLASNQVLSWERALTLKKLSVGRGLTSALVSCSWMLKIQMDMRDQSRVTTQLQVRRPSIAQSYMNIGLRKNSSKIL